MRRLVHLFHLTARERIFGQPCDCKLSVTDDRGEHIVEIVRDSAGQLPDGLHLLRLAELFFEPPAFGHVATIEDDP